MSPPTTAAAPDLSLIEARLAWLDQIIRPRLERFMGYYRNATTDLAAILPCAKNTSFCVRPFRQFQELGLPARVTGFRRAADGSACATGTIDLQRKEVVIENDIAWRINTLVDFVAGRMPAIVSTARDPATRDRLNRIIQDLLNCGGGLMLLQQLVLHAAIDGSAWIHLRPTAALLQKLAPNPTAQSPAGTESVTGPAASADQDIASLEAGVGALDMPLGLAHWLRLEIVAAARLCPLPRAGEEPAEELFDAAILREPPATASSGHAMPPAPRLVERVRSWFSRGLAATPPAATFDLFSRNHWWRYINGTLTDQGENLLRTVPFIRYENQPDPAAGTRVGAAGSHAVNVGLGEIEPLVGLQDELNTRLSDRAYRVTMTSFRMYLGKGIDDFIKRPIGPGQMWQTDNAAATVDAFGGDAATPSEDSHISEIRDALDKISGVSAVAAGLVRGKIGNLTSAVALRLTLIALLARTERRRAALTKTLADTITMALDILDRAGIVTSDPRDRGIDVNWPTPLPESDLDRLQEAQAKVALGVPRNIILGELGYAEALANAPRTDLSP